MKKLFVGICAFLIVLMFVSCKTTPKATSETSKSAKPLAASAVNLNGKWKVNGEWQAGGNSGSFNMKIEIVQKGTEIIIITQSGEKIPGTLEGDVVRLEAGTTTTPNTGVTNSFPDREYKVSQDGNTLNSEFRYTWDNGRDRGDGIMAVTYIRE